jgi:polar amino acid transport system substrate-binding protein
MTVDSSIRASFACHGHLRASLNLGNPILANIDPTSGKPFGVSIDLAVELARRLGVDVELIAFDTASRSVQAVTDEDADIGFFAIDPVRVASIAFTAPYALVEGFFLVRDESAVKRNDDVDHAHNRVAVGNGSAYDLFLSRELKRAQIVRAPSSPTVVGMFMEQGLEVAAGVRHQLERQAAAYSGLRLLPERFMVIEQAMGLPKTRSEEAALFLKQFVEEMKASGFVADSLARHGIAGASIAPAAEL